MDDLAYVLVLEADPAVAALLRDVLGAPGLAVAVHHDAPSALAAARRRRPLLVVAASVPWRTLGVAFAARYRAAPGPHAPVILLTDDLAADDLPIEPPVVCILRKPFTLAALRAAVRPYLPAPARGPGA